MKILTPCEKLDDEWSNTSPLFKYDTSSEVQVE